MLKIGSQNTDYKSRSSKKPPKMSDGEKKVRFSVTEKRDKKMTSSLVSKDDITEMQMSNLSINGRLQESAKIEFKPTGRFKTKEKKNKDAAEEAWENEQNDFDPLEAAREKEALKLPKPIIEIEEMTEER